MFQFCKAIRGANFDQNHCGELRSGGFLKYPTEPPGDHSGFAQHEALLTHVGAYRAFH